MSATAPHHADNIACSRMRNGQTRREEAWNSMLHALGAAAALVAGIHLIRTIPDSPVKLGCTIAYIVTLATLLATSAIYHALPTGPRKDLFQLLDRAAIYLAIAGTYTPIGLLMEGGRIGIGLCAAEWALAAAGVASVALGRHRFLALSAWVYQFMGWLTAFGMRRLLANAGPAVVWGLALGGIAYIAGVLFLVRDHRPYFHPISHALVIIGAGIQFGAISLFLHDAHH